MADYSQEKQPMRIFTDLPDDTLLLEELNGEEGVSRPYRFTLDLVSEDPNVDGEGLLRSEVRVEIGLPEGGTRHIHGIIRSFSQRGQSRDLVTYRVEVVPWLWFLSLARDSRIFQGKSVLEIVEEVFQGQGYSDFDIRCTRSYESREYTVQYRESNLNFVSRLLEEEGIFYFFEHSDSGHMLVLADDAAAFPDCEGQPEARMHSQAVPEEDVVLELVREHQVHSGEVTVGGYDYLQPSLTLRTTVAGDEPEELYEQPEGFEDLDRGDHLARLALEREEARRQMAQGESTCRGFVSGTSFELLDHFGDDVNRTWVLMELRHKARNAAFRGGSGRGEFDYRNEFVAMPDGVPYRPPLRARKPRIHGAQTAQVVGPSGEKIWVDEYSRVKVHFHWDRLGGRDDGSSCWVRVSQNWAGKQWGGMFIPHVGQEVIVDFLEGDPDRPIITGRVYNAEHMPPQDLPANKHKSIIEDDFGNEMVFDATPGSEHIRIHSPSHTSTIELGRSLFFKSDSDWMAIIDGDAGSIHKGPQIGGNIGAKYEIDLGGKFSAFVGFKFDLSLSEAFKIELGPSVKIATGKEYKFSKSAFKQQTTKEILLSSAKSAVITGGSGKESIVDGNAERLVLQYGKEAKKEESVRSKVAHTLAFSAGLIGGLASSILASVDWSKEEEADLRSYAILGAGGLIPAAHGTVGLIGHIMNVKKKEKIEDSDSFHGGGGSKHSNAIFNKEGVFLTAYGPSRQAWLSLFGDGSQKGKAAIQSDKEIELKSKMVKLEAEMLMVLKAKNVIIESNAITTLKGTKMIKIG
ncbi:MAG: type VI secretion system tip protein VgrG [Gemmatimonadales bacterium]|nr:MAG: type VI secretion system tip protein VgrG [Gemmatimonadales bacterium]